MIHLVNSTDSRVKLPYKNIFLLCPKVKFLV